jgi:ubiquinone/menaquinone biosynthesis C-methylase UbiE
VETDQIADRYNRFARCYDLCELVPERLGLEQWRRRLLASAGGDVLEIGVGTGKNLPLYPPGCRITGIDVSTAMLSKARARADKYDVDVRLELMDAARLSFADESFDTVVDTLSLCTFSDPSAVLKELGRVCRRAGRILLLEHGRSDRQWLAEFQDRHAAQHAAPLGCVWNRDPIALVADAGLRVVRVEPHVLGVIGLIWAAPGESASGLSGQRIKASDSND